MNIGRYDISIRKNIAYYDTLTYYNADGSLVDLTGFTAKSQFKKNVDSSDSILTLTTANGYLVLGDALGTVKYAIPKAIVDTLPVGSFVHDLALINGTDDTWFIEGSVTIVKGVTE